MYKRSIFFILVTIVLFLIWQQFNPAAISGENIVAAPKYTKHILFVPLDSRPPCLKFVVDAAKLDNTEVITPPQLIMDYYTEAGNTQALRQWLADNAGRSDGIIISIDQLLYGGLLASRESFGKDTRQEDLWQMLRNIRQENPQLPVYAFNILPRITPPANIDSPKDIKRLMKYSRLADKFSKSYDAKDLTEMEELRTKIPQEKLEEYLSLYNKNLQLNKKLIDLAKDKVITKLVIGQDDGEKYGIPNMEKRSLERYAADEMLDSRSVALTHGADEVGMSMLFSMAQTFSQDTYAPKIFVAYNDDSSADAVLPYMAAPVEQIVAEKILLSGGTAVQQPDDADFILYLHIGDTDNLSSRFSGMEKINTWLKEGKKVAVVDLSRHFDPSEILLPVLLQNDVPVNRLLAYSGWNTVSNSVGTAIAQAGLYCLAEKNLTDREDALQLAFNNLTILYDHFIEDYFYLKGTIDKVNISLRKAGINNVSDLNMDNNYFWANQMLSESLQRQLDKFAWSKASRLPVPVKTPDGTENIYLRGFKVNAFFPWPRTFEIYTDVNFTMTAESKQYKF